MKLLIASDLHGSAYYTKKLLQAIESEQSDKVLLLGDLLYHGPRNDLPRDYAPKKVIEMLNSVKEKLLCVRGNCEAEVDQMVLSFPVLAEYAVLFLEGRRVYAVHGHKNMDLPFCKGDLVFSGHTHVPLIEERNGIYYANPGSVSIPKEGSVHGYMTLCGDTLYHKSLDGEGIISAFQF